MWEFTEYACGVKAFLFKFMGTNLVKIKIEIKIKLVTSCFLRIFIVVLLQLFVLVSFLVCGYLYYFCYC